MKSPEGIDEKSTYFFGLHSFADVRARKPRACRRFATSTHRPTSIGDKPR